MMLLTGVLGWLASFQLTVDDWRLLRDPSYQPPCNISPVVSCGSVMSSPQGSLFGFPNMLLGLGAFAAVAALGLAVLTGARLHRRLWLALDAGALVGVVFVHWLIVQSLYELNKICPYCACVWISTIALFWYVTVHCLEQGILPAAAACAVGRPGHALDAARRLVRGDRAARPHPLLDVLEQPAVTRL